MNPWLVKPLGLIATCAAAGALTSCGAADDDRTASEPGGNVATSAIPAHSRLVGPPEFAAAIAEPARVTSNVHVPFEGDIPGTDLSIPFDRIDQQASQLPADRNTPLAVYCRRGPMSATAVEELTQLGYIDVVELQGGMQAWQASGRTLVGP